MHGTDRRAPVSILSPVTQTCVDSYHKGNENTVELSYAGTYLSEVVLQLPKDHLQLVDFPRQSGRGAANRNMARFRNANEPQWI